MFFYYPILWEATHYHVSISGGGCCYARRFSCLKIVPMQLCHVYHFSVAFVFLLVSVCCNAVQAKVFEQCVTKSRWKPMNRTTGARPLPSYLPCLAVCLCPKWTLPTEAVCGHPTLSKGGHAHSLQSKN